MAQTNLDDVAAQMKTKWSSLFVKELRSSKPLPELVSKDYRGEIVNEHSQVTVSMLQKARGQRRTGADANSFDSEKMVLQDTTVVSNQRFVASFEIAELATLQSQLSDPAMQSNIRDSLMEAIAIQWNDYLWSLVAPSNTGATRLVLNKASLAATDLQAYRVIAGQSKWRKDKPWYFLADPVYHGDLLGQTTMVSKDYVGDEAPTVAGEIVNKRYGFSIVEDNSRVSKIALGFHPDFLISVIQKEAQFKISDLHSQKKFGYVISVDLFGGAKLNLQGDKQHLFVTNSATNNAASSSSD